MLLRNNITAKRQFRLQFNGNEYFFLLKNKNCSQIPVSVTKNLDSDLVDITKKNFKFVIK